MGKSQRSSRIKTNNQALKKKVFGPVETARNERQNAKLLALAQQGKEEKMAEAAAAVDESEHQMRCNIYTLPAKSAP